MSLAPLRLNLEQAGELAASSAYRTWAWLSEEVTARCQPNQPLVRLMDGQPSLWDASDAEEFRQGPYA